MKVSNIVITTVAAISTAGVLGLAYAQSSTSDPQPGTSATTQDATPGAMDRGGDATPDSRSQDFRSQDSTDTTGTTRSRSTYNERVARADRN